MNQESEMKQSSTILIVDDEPMVREFFEALLIPEGYQLALACSGSEALAKAAELNPDLILLDVMMPGMDGFEVCRRLRADPHLAQVPVIMVTALLDRDDRLQGIEVGADDFISKPVDQVELRTRVRTISRLNRYRRLREERAKFEWVVEHATDGYLMVSDNDDIQYANQQARLYLGLAADDSAPFSETFLELVRKQYRREPQEAWATWPEQPTGQTSRYLVQPETPTTNAFWLQVHALNLPSSPDGNWMVHLHDVTAQMTLQRDIWEFQAMVSHKLRTPLASVITGLDLLADEGLEKLMNSEMAGLFNLVLRSAQRLNNGVHDVLEYMYSPALAQSGAGFNLLQLQPLVAQISGDLGLAAVSVSDEVGLNAARLSLSEQAVELILREILENAKNFHPQQAPTVEVLVSSLKGNKQVSIQISDDGLTLSPQLLSQVWIPYYQGDKYFTGEVTGMGLGLSMVALLIWAAGGICRMYNRKEGSGVVVELILPLTDHMYTLPEPPIIPGKD